MTTYGISYLGRSHKQRILECQSYHGDDLIMSGFFSDEKTEAHSKTKYQGMTSFSIENR